MIRKANKTTAKLNIVNQYLQEKNIDEDFEEFLLSIKEDLLGTNNEKGND